MNDNKIKILLVEDDINLSTVLRDYLEMLGYSVNLCEDGKKGLKEFKKVEFDLCLFDIMMPVKDGFTLAEEIRRFDKATPIIFLSAKSFKEDKIRGFEIGCDDYITKPFSTEELSLRIHAILRRCLNNTGILDKSLAPTYQIGKYEFNYDSLTLTSGTTTKVLTRKESELLKLLCDKENQVLKREEALQSVWGRDSYFIGRSMDVFISKLRKLLKDDPNISIRNIHGIGFKLDIFEDQA